jgi:hypothetical protein
MSRKILLGALKIIDDIETAQVVFPVQMRAERVRLSTSRNCTKQASSVNSSEKRSIERLR